jgi:hypothetical protein
MFVGVGHGVLGLDAWRAKCGAYTGEVWDVHRGIRTG